MTTHELLLQLLFFSYPFDGGNASDDDIIFIRENYLPHTDKKSGFGSRTSKITLFIGNTIRKVGYYQRHTIVVKIFISGKKLAYKVLPKMKILIVVA